MYVHVPFFRRVLPVYLALVVTLSMPSLLLAQAVDTTPPSVSVTTPPGGAVVAGNVTVSAAAYDNGSVVGLLFQINGAQLGPELTSGGCIGGLTAAADWNTTATPDGNYTIVATARDAGGNATSSTPITVTVMNTPPPGGFPAPSPGSSPSPAPTPTSPEVTNPLPLPWAPDKPPPVFAGGCTIPDPFVIFGGGRCVNGGWLPPGVIGGTVPPAGPVVAGGCITPDPFVSLGGGTCFNGSWYPPAITATAPSAPVTPTSAPPVVGGCSTPDPFAAFGGGRCVNGGWLPPGMIDALPQETTDRPRATEADPIAPVAGGCTTPDPFLAFGGGRCVNGGWLPPGMFVPPLPSTGDGMQRSTVPSVGGCLTPDPFSSIPGLAGVCVNGGWIPITREAVR